MQKENIKAIKPSCVTTLKEHFSVTYPKYGRGSISLSAYGDYSLDVQGITDTSARRTTEYKNAFNSISMKMLKAYESENNGYIAIHRNMPPVQNVSSYEQELMKLKPNVYKRVQFSMPRPTKSEVENDLRNEVNMINFNAQRDKKVSEKEYIAKHLNTLIELRGQAWQEAFNLFKSIEDAKEKVENSKFAAEHRRNYAKKQEFIKGSKSLVKDSLSLVCKQINIPYDASIEFDYQQDQHLLTANVTFLNGIMIPASKAVILASGKISVKNKLVREMISEKTDSTLSTVYYLTSLFFNVSPNIHYLRFACYDSTIQNPILWVEFSRDVFSKVSPKTVNLHSDILGYPHVIDFKTRGDALDLALMDSSYFKRNVFLEIERINQVRQTESQNSIYNGDNIVLTFEDANRLVDIPRLSNVIKKAIAISKDKGLSYVVLDKQYRGIVQELISL